MNMRDLLGAMDVLYSLTVVGAVWVNTPVKVTRLHPRNGCIARHVNYNVGSLKG